MAGDRIGTEKVYSDGPGFVLGVLIVLIMLSLAAETIWILR